MMLAQECILVFFGFLNDDDAGSKRLRTSHLYDVGLYRATLEKLLNIIETASHFV